MKNFTAAILFILLTFVSVKGQVVINEVSSTNTGVFTDDFNNYSDWIELYNGGSVNVPLNNYALSDNGSTLRKWIFPNVTIPAGGYIIVVPSDSSLTNVVNHWETAVKANDAWKYYSASAIADTNWRNLSFNDASWSTGIGGFGYGDGDDGTTISNTRSVLLRKIFSVQDTSKIINAIFNIDFDDGYVAYLNGVEIARKNMGNPGNRPLNNVYASASHEAVMYSGEMPDSVFISKSTLAAILKNGNNVLAVEVHDRSLSTDLTSNAWLSFGISDYLYTWNPVPTWFRGAVKGYLHTNFELDRAGQTLYLSDPSSVIIDQKLIPAMELNASYGRSPDGGSTYCSFSPGTPGLSNNSSTCYNGVSSSPVISVSAGFYTSAQSVSISTTQIGGVIRYTTDGSEPTSGSAQYSGPLTININTMLRARVFSNGTLLPSAVVSNSYFINETAHLPVYSITMNPADLYDYNTGIYVMGPNASTTSPYFGANFWQEWNRTANVEYFNKQKVRDFTFQTEISINGGYSRSKPQKSFELNMDDKYGMEEIVYNLIPDKSYITKWDDWILRNAGSDWLKVHYRDVLFEHAMKNTFLSYLAAEPCVVYMNGSYFGVYWQTENDDQHFVKNNFGYKKAQIDLLKEAGHLEIRQGSDTGFIALYNYATTADPTTTQFYNTMDGKVDLKNYADYFAVETYMNNSDWIGPWTNNIKLWRPRLPQLGKWKYILYDLDQCLGLNSNYSDNALHRTRFPDVANYQSPIFNAMCNNPTFKTYFINRYADLINTAFLPSVMNSYAYTLRDSISADMPNTLAKYGGSVSTWNSNISNMVNYINRRPQYARNSIQSEFGLTSQVTLTLNASPAGAGHIIINTITPTTLPWTGVYFNGNPVTITAVPAPGYTFDHWRSNVVINSNNPNRSVNINFTSNDVITAYFTGSPASAQLTFSEINYKSKSNKDAGDWVEVHNYGTAAVDMTGWYFRDGDDSHKTIFPDAFVLQPGDYVVIYEDSVKFHNINPTVNNIIGPTGYGFDNAGENLRLYSWNSTEILNCRYSNTAPWPTGANGNGYTLEQVSPTGNLNDGTNWFAGCLSGSAGREFIQCCPVIATITASGTTTICNGDSLLLTATTGTGYIYQWQVNGVAIAGGINSTFYAKTGGSYTVNISDGTCNINSNSIPVTVNNCCNITAHITANGPLEFCTGGSVLLTATVDPLYSYQWQRNGVNISGETAGNYTAVSTGQYSVIISNGTCSKTSDTLNVSLVQIVNATITPSGPTTFCAGGNVLLVGNAGTGLTYQWMRNSVDISGAINSSYLAADSGSYTLAVTNTCGTSVSSVVIVSWNGTMFASISAPTNIICSGQAVVLTASPSGSAYSYVWKKNNTILTGSIRSVHNASPTSTATYYVTVTGPCGTSISPGFTITVNPVPVPTFTANGPTAFCQGQNVTFTANSGSGILYQWQRNGVNISNAVSQTYVASTAGSYRIKETNSYGCSAYSSTRTVTINCRVGSKEEPQTSASTLEMMVYPNPFTHQTAIQIRTGNTDKEIVVQIFDITGNLVFQKNGIISGAEVVVGDELSPGIYLAVIAQGDERKSIRIIKSE